MSTTVPVLVEEVHSISCPTPLSPHSSLTSVTFITHLVTSLVEVGDSRWRLELLRPRVWDISTEVTWFRVMLPSAAFKLSI